MSVWRAYYTISTMLCVHLIAGHNHSFWSSSLIELYCYLNSPFWSNEELWFYTHKVTRLQENPKPRNPHGQSGGTVTNIIANICFECECETVSLLQKHVSAAMGSI